MKVKVPVIWKETEKLSEDDMLTLRALNKNPEVNKLKGFVTIEFNEIESWFDFEENTKVNLKSGDYYTVDIDENTFSMLYQEFSSEVIKSVQYSRNEDGREIDEEEDEDNGDY